MYGGDLSLDGNGNDDDELPAETSMERESTEKKWATLKAASKNTYSPYEHVGDGFGLTSNEVFSNESHNFQLSEEELATYMRIAARPNATLEVLGAYREQPNDENPNDDGPNDNGPNDESSDDDDEQVIDGEIAAIDARLAELDASSAALGLSFERSDSDSVDHIDYNDEASIERRIQELVSAREAQEAAEEQERMEERSSTPTTDTVQAMEPLEAMDPEWARDDENETTPERRNQWMRDHALILRAAEHERFMAGLQARWRARRRGVYNNI